ncbi:hypothetical protein [Stutzerimonas xanthomarina]|uniref:hypothetical protein n=1 Tax=Stutzerimonas xanthomarina TaxID=271420 RepID=UPI003AA9432F
MHRAHSPFSKVAAEPRLRFFVTAIDTHPLAADPASSSLNSRFSPDPVRLTRPRCSRARRQCPLPGESPPVQVESFNGPHPAGWRYPHPFLDPVSASKSVWTIGYWN